MLAGTWVALVIVALLASRVAVRTWRRRGLTPGGEPSSTPSDDAGFSPVDVAEIADRLRGVEAEEAVARCALLESRVRPLVRRHVPLHVVEAVPELRTIRMRFADGSAFVGHGESAGDAGVLAAALRRDTMCPASCHSDALGTHVVFGSAHGRHRVSMILTGLDQAR